MVDAVVIPPPSRWDEPFDSRMTDATVAEVLTLAPFNGIDSQGFPAPLTLSAIIKNDARLLEVNTGAILIREGDFDTSIFFILEGQLQVTLGKEMMVEARGGVQMPRRGPLAALAQLWRNRRVPEVRGMSSNTAATKVAADISGGSRQRLYFKNVEKVLECCPDTATLGVGDMFGESSALGRSPRSATVFAASPARLLEIRWQGFRDILKRDAELRDQVNAIYRQRALKTRLRASALFSHLSESELVEVADKTLFESYGNYDWNVSFKRQRAEKRRYRLGDEPMLAEEGHYADGLIMLCAGFGRTDIRVDHGYHTLAYLSPGDTFGLEEITHNWLNSEAAPLPLQRSLRAIGYAHILRIPTAIVESYLLEARSATDLPSSLPAVPRSYGALTGQADTELDQATLEFLVEQRFINGTATMLIDLDRCTRCDDCVRACAATHDNNPRFIRHGPVFDHFMVANACMHCSDPVCMIGCPTGAIHRRTDGGEIVIDDATCIGCATCANSCPYDNIRMVRIRDEQNTLLLNQQTFAPVLRATKCDLCAEQMAGVVPACQNACPHDALVRMDMGKKQTLASWLNR